MSAMLTNLYSELVIYQQFYWYNTILFIEKIDKPQFKNKPTEILKFKVKNT